MEARPALGLERGKTIVKAYDSRWAGAYEDECARLRSALGETEVALEHVGSTAVPGLASKPILDIAAGYADAASLTEISRCLASVGYAFHGDQGDEGGFVFIKGPEAARTHYLHLVGIDSVQWRNYLAFRDALRASEALRIDYAGLKRRLAKRFPDDRLAYLEGKDAFVKEVLAGRA